MLSNQPHLCRSRVHASPQGVLSYKGRANQLRGNSWGRRGLRGPSLAWLRSYLSIRSLFPKSPGQSINKRETEARFTLGEFLSTWGRHWAYWRYWRRTCCRPTEEGLSFQPRLGKTSWDKRLQQANENQRRVANVRGKEEWSRWGTWSVQRLRQPPLPFACNLLVPFIHHEPCVLPSISFCLESLHGKSNSSLLLVFCCFVIITTTVTLLLYYEHLQCANILPYYSLLSPTSP